MPKSDKTPLLLKIVRWIFPKLEKVDPGLASIFFWNLFFTPLHYPIPPKELEIANQADRFILMVQGRKIQAYAWGEGPVILLVHGWAGRATQFRKFIPVLVAAGYKVIAFDGPAHGRSPGKKANIEEFSAAFQQLMVTIGEPVGVIAHSFGGGVCLYSCLKGVRIRKLINIASPTIADEIIKTYLRAVNGSWPTAIRFKEKILSTYGKAFDAYTSLVFSKDISEKPELLLIHDCDDKEVPIAHAYAYLKEYPGTQLMETRGLGHTRILKDDMVISQCLAFLERPAAG